MSKHNNLQSFFISLFVVSVFIIIIFCLYKSDYNINNSNITFINSYGWLVEPKPEEITRLSVPRDFNDLYSFYNALEASAGFDLTPYKGKNAVRYSYKVLNHSNSDTGLIRANVFITKDKIVAADISSLEIGGFIQPICDTTGQSSH